ncbi:MAG: WecB/TagA/CpsF family glycosyltransferase [Phormidesmis sp.]
MSTILGWAKQRLSKTVLVANAHMLVEGVKDEAFSTVLKRADIVTPDGMPLVWMIRLLTGKAQDRVAGMDILLSLCDRAEAENVGVYFFGAEQATLDIMRQKLTAQFPKLTISGMKTLPFCKTFTAEQDQEVAQAINESGAGIVFVALGCPKQERWMSKNKDQVNAVMIGVGGAFSVYAGLKKWAPMWIRQSGLEWLYRFLQEPKRLWKRYLTTNSRFVWLALKQLVRG